MKHKSDGAINCDRSTRYSHQRIDKGTRGRGNKRESRDHLDYSIVEIGWNTEKGPGDWRRLPVTQTPVKKY